MFRHAIVVGLTLAFLSGIVACAHQVRPPPDGISGGPLAGLSTYREIKIESNPTGASIFIDGRPFGATPQAIRVDDDRQTIRVMLRKSGYLDKVGELYLADLTDETTVINVNLMPRY